jgi:hypothetical protein
VWLCSWIESSRPISNDRRSIGCQGGSGHNTKSEYQCLPTAESKRGCATRFHSHLPFLS